MSSIHRLPLAAGLLSAAIATAGLGWEAWRFGSDEASSRSRLEAEVRGRITQQAGAIRELASRVAADAATLVTSGTGSLADHRPALFTQLSTVASLAASSYIPVLIGVP